MPTNTKAQHYRRQSRGNKLQVLLIGLFVLLVLAVLVGLILALNSKMFVEPR